MEWEILLTTLTWLDRYSSQSCHSRNKEENPQIKWRYWQMKPTWSTAQLHTEHGWNWPMLADQHIQIWILNQMWHAYLTIVLVQHSITVGWEKQTAIRFKAFNTYDSLSRTFPIRSTWVGSSPSYWFKSYPSTCVLPWVTKGSLWLKAETFLFDHPLFLPEFKVGWLPLWHPDHVDGLELQHTRLVHWVSQWYVDRDIPYENMDSNTVHRGCLPQMFNTRWDLLLPMSQATELVPDWCSPTQ